MSQKVSAPVPAATDILEVRHVSVSYQDNGLGIFGKRKEQEVLHDVSFSVHRDEFFGLVGESGCGKSTLGRAILGLLPFSGTILVDGMAHKTAGREAFTRKIQAVFQDPMSALDPRKTIGFTMEEPLKVHHMGDKAARRAAVSRMLEQVGLDASYASRTPEELSGGQRQRVCIGAALLAEPELVIADECVSALDVSVGAQILNLFREIDAAKDFAMLFISHNLSVVYYLCDRIGVMYRGRIVELGTADDICLHPLHPYTKLLLHAIPDFSAKITGETNPKQEAEFETPREDPPRACCFYHRCPHAGPSCLAQPALRTISGEHACACVLAGTGREETP